MCLLEEAHVAIQHATYGKEIAQLLVDIVQLGRKRGIHLIVSTQAPTKDSMPRDVTRNCSNGIAFAVGDHVANDALLGQGAYAGGHRATELIPGTDRGTAVVKGFTGRTLRDRAVVLPRRRQGQRPGHPDHRAGAGGDRQARQARPAGTPGRGRSRPATCSPTWTRSSETDPVPIADVPALLKRLAPTWTPYQGLTGKALREHLDADTGSRSPRPGNRYPLDPATVRDAIVRREQDCDERPGAAADDGRPLAS